MYMVQENLVRLENISVRHDFEDKKKSFWGHQDMIYVFVV